MYFNKYLCIEAITLFSSIHKTHLCSTAKIFNISQNLIPVFCECRSLKMAEPDLFVKIIQILSFTLMPKYMFQNYFLKKKCVTLIAKCLINKYSHNQVPSFLSDYELCPMKRQYCT